MTADLYNPWAGLKHRQDILIQFDANLPPGVTATTTWMPRLHVITLHTRLTQPERNHRLTHELVHIERGHPCPGYQDTSTFPGPWLAREERIVETIVTNRMIPPTDLLAWATPRAQVGEPVEPWMVAEEWHTPHHTAVMALEMLNSQQFRLAK